MSAPHVENELFELTLVRIPAQPIIVVFVRFFCRLPQSLPFGNRVDGKARFVFLVFIGLSRDWKSISDASNFPPAPAKNSRQRFKRICRHKERALSLACTKRIIDYGGQAIIDVAGILQAA